MTFRCLPTTRVEAKRLGLPLYDNGQACLNGHESIRRTANWTCIVCARIKQRDVNKLKARGTRTYVGSPCRYGHGNLRLTSSKGCCVCIALRIKRWSQKHRKENRTLYSAKLRTWHNMNPGKQAEYRRVQYLRHMQRYKHWSQLRRARQAGAEGHFSGEDISALFTAQRGFCAGPCGRALRVFGYHVDHKTPLSRGGSNWPDNLQLLCPKCNGSKGTKTDDEWRATFALSV